ncbi:L-type lectin-domain containing receptor kinase IX.1-like [Zingiber officinale]|uniref:L-type lectin-domain containing receptor kinase IX.1-like n=1 Tax=Zingiber officinale TaxID=94328 RepID=UPI001C4D8040|nr:L-type lectin-domain containing receptor kinase IX.1-like [Zingiber officinale]
MMRRSSTLMISIVVICLLAAVPSSSSLFFNFSNFYNVGNGSDILLQGDALNSNNFIELTKNTGSELNTDSVGRASYYKELLLLWDAQTGQLTDFTTRFVFSIAELINPAIMEPGDGLAFFLSAPPYLVPVDSNGRGLGLFSNVVPPPPTPPHSTVAVEFDTFQNKEYGDPPYRHVGIDVNSLNSTKTAAWSNDSVADMVAWVIYNGTSHNLSVFLSSEDDRELSDAVLVLSDTIDLRKVLPEEVVIGFSAATGGSGVETHTIHSWSLDSTLQPRKKGKTALLTCFVVGGAILVFLVAASGALWFFKRRQRTNGKDEEDDWMFDEAMDDEFERERGPKRFAYPELVRATRDFSDEGKLGEGGFGSVYRGVLKDPKLEVAIKKVSKGSKQGRKEYMSEVKIISRLRHRNLVQLVGWCHDRQELLLVYELVPNGSLDSYLHGGAAKTLDWGVRHRVALGLASALFYLHEEWEQCVVHRDVKPSNVMLDSTFSAKLGDFGLARLLDHHGGPQTMTVLAGTIGYMAPEYFYTGKASKESDVYSFGIVALEIACGRRPLMVEESGTVELARCVWELYGRKMILEAADENLKGEFDKKQMECLMVVGLWCAHPDPKLRPSMKQAINVLNFDSPWPELPPAMPVPTYGPAPLSELTTTRHEHEF